MKTSLLSSSKHFFKYVLQISGVRIILAPLGMSLVKNFILKGIKGKYYFRGSFGSKDWIPFVSDIDINVVDEVFQQHYYKVFRKAYLFKRYLRFEIGIKVFPMRIDDLYFKSGMYYHHASPWENDPNFDRRRNLWLCLREITKRYPDQLKAPPKAIYIPAEKQKDTWLKFARELKCEHLAAAIKTQKDLSLKQKLSASACLEVFWENYFIKLQIIQNMPKAQKYFRDDESLEVHSALNVTKWAVAPIMLVTLEALKEDCKKHSLPVFPAGHEDLYVFLPKVGIFSIEENSLSIPKLALLQWAIETMVIFQDNPYVFKYDQDSKKRLEECIYERIPRLRKLLFGTDTISPKNEELSQEFIQQKHQEAENLLRRAMQLNKLTT